MILIRGCLAIALAMSLSGALAAGPNPEDVPHLLQQAKGLMARDKFTLAIPLLEEARRQSPDSAEVHRCLFISYRVLEKTSLGGHAAFHASRLACLRPGTPEAREAEAYLQTAATTYRIAPTPPRSTSRRITVKGQTLAKPDEI